VEAVASSISSAQTGARRIKTAGFLLAVLTLAVLAAGGWGLLSSLSAEVPSRAARVGEPVKVPGGSMLVGSVTPEHMAPMQSKKFAASGMSMSSMGMDMAPEGSRRFAVEVTLAAERDNLSYSPRDFRLTAAGMKKEATPIRHQLEGGTIPVGSAVSGSLVFQVPEDVRALRLGFGDGGGQRVALDLDESATEGNAHSHGGVQPQGNEHSDGHHHNHHK
jgi:hypothetical protein